MKNIVIVSFNARGGLHHYITQLSNALSDRMRVDLIVPRGSEMSHFSSNVTVHEENLGNTKKNFVINTLCFWRIAQLILFIHKRKPSVVHFNGCYPWMIFLLPFIRGIPIVITIHDIVPHPGSSKTDIQAIRTALLSFADRVIVHGEYAKNNISNVRSDIIRIVPHGNYSFFSDGSTETDGTGDTFLFFGRVSEYKGIGYLVQAINELNGEGRNLKLIIAGEGDLSPYHDQMKDRSWFEIHNRYIPDEEVPELFGRAAAVVLPYIEVTQSGVVQIALAFKKPVISTNVGCLPEIITDGVSGRLVEPGDVSTLKKAIAEMADNRIEARQMGLRGHELVNSDYSWERIADLTIKVYDEIT